LIADEFEKGDFIVQVLQKVDFEQQVSLWDLLRETVVFLWKEWSQDMELSNFTGERFVLRGQCPHCHKQAAFPSVTTLYGSLGEYTGYRDGRVAGAQCLACNKFILAIVGMIPIDGGGRWVYVTHYPLGTPNDDVPEEIPESIREDFKEALRCRWVDAYNATLEMCRRALESSCMEQGAKPDVALAKMIDWVYAQQKITASLRDVAHHIKLSGNRGAHPSDRAITADDADAVIEFTREYFQHVYVTPAKMRRFTFDKPTKP
jgi:hypothetical protein